MKKRLIIGFGLIAIGTMLVGCSNKDSVDVVSVEDIEKEGVIDSIHSKEIVSGKSAIKFGDLQAEIKHVFTDPDDKLTIVMDVENKGKETVSLQLNELELHYYDNGKRDNLVNVYLPTSTDATVEIGANKVESVELNYYYGSATDVVWNSMLRFKSFDDRAIIVKDVPISEYVNVAL